MEWDDGFVEETEVDEWTGSSVDSIFSLLPILEAIQQNNVPEFQRLFLTLSDEQIGQLQEYMRALQPDVAYNQDDKV